MLEIKFKHSPVVADPANKQFVADLRKDLPEIFDQVSDDMLYSAYSQWSEDNYCAGWLTHSKESLRKGFLKDIVLVDRFGNEFEPIKGEDNGQES